MRFWAVFLNTQGMSSRIYVSRIVAKRDRWICYDKGRRIGEYDRTHWTSYKAEIK